MSSQKIESADSSKKPEQPWEVSMNKKVGRGIDNQKLGHAGN